MKRKLAIIFLVLIMSLCTAVGCSNGNKRDTTGMVKVTYHLEGGVYRNCTEPVVMYYGFKEGTENKIKDPGAEDKKDRPKTDDANAQVKRDEYKLDGWYRVKTGEGENVEYADKWNFATDKVTSAGVELYAKWLPVIRYAYNVCYIDEDGTKVVLGSYTVNAGDKFEDKRDFKNKRSGYTALDGFFDADGNPWDESFVHPGGEKDTEIDVFAKYERGEFVQVYTAEELTANRTKDIILMADIDFGGKEFAGFGDYRKIFRGNGHTISNFKLKYDASAYIYDEDLGDEDGTLCISLFGNMRDAIVQDVTFEDFTVDIDISFTKLRKIIVAPLCVKAENSAVSNVTVKPVYKFTKLPSQIDKNDPDQFVLVTDKAYYFQRESTFENVSVTVDDRTESAE